MSLEELMASYNSLTEKENREFEFHAKIAGAWEGQSKEQKDSLSERLEKRKQEKLEQEAASSEKGAQIFEGTGYQVIRG